jgi:glycosyltransferase involved in cell wall biosynthesis
MAAYEIISQFDLVVATNDPQWRIKMADDFRDRVERIVLDILERFQIDVAHLHSIQILTGSVVQALRKSRIPTLVTLHDGWWLSEHQFLVDDRGHAFLPASDSSELFETETDRMSLEQRVWRRQFLGNLLRSCSRVVAVSESFAEVYRNAGFASVGVIENGVDPLGGVVARVRPSGKVRIGFIGGMAAHKGYNLILAAARSGNFENLEFVVVDHAASYGHSREASIGGSRVTYVGKFPQAKVHELYAMIDILAAPSIWPESYGLVVREAMSAGIPVIVGNRGDIARGVRDGVDGWIVNVADEKDIAALFDRLDKDPSLANLRPQAPKVVSVAEAVDTLVKELRAICTVNAGSGAER